MFQNLLYPSVWLWHVTVIYNVTLISNSKPKNNNKLSLLSLTLIVIEIETTKYYSSSDNPQMSEIKIYKVI